MDDHYLAGGRLCLELVLAQRADRNFNQPFITAVLTNSEPCWKQLLRLKSLDSLAHSPSNWYFGREVPACVCDGLGGVAAQ